MEKKSGVGETTTALPSGGGALRSIGDTFQPNLAMGGGSYKVPFDLPLGPGGFAPKLDLLYNTGYGNGVFGLGWALSVPFVETRRRSPYAPAGEPEYALAGAETLVPIGGGRFVPFVQAAYQTFDFDGTQWTSRAPNLVQMRFGATDASRIAGVVDGQPRVSRWLLDRVTFPGDRLVEFEYEADGPQRYLRRVRWSVFTLELEHEQRPDPFSQFDTGFEVRTTRRCVRLALHQSRLAPSTLMREYRLEYQAGDGPATSLLRALRIAGFRQEDGALQETRLPALTFDYTRFDPGARRIVRLASDTVPPPPLGDDVTLLDYRGTALPGVLRMNGLEATYWENRGFLRWGPPQRLPALPQGLHLGDDRVRFADLTGNGTADVIVAAAQGGGFFPNDPERGFQPKHTVALAPSFDLGEEGSWLLDLDGDGVADLLTFRNGVPLAFFNEQGQRWRGPAVLPSDDLPNFNAPQPRLRFADMNGDGIVDMVLLISRRVVYWPGLGHGRWGPARAMASTPGFDVPDPDEDVHLADIDGDGCADLVLVGDGVIRVYPNVGGEAFADAISLRRAPRPGSDRLLLADMTGSGTVGFLWTRDGDAPEYWFLDPLNGVKPYLLRQIDNGAGLVTTIEYTTSAFERATDLVAGRRWSGYLPFAVHVVSRLTQRDTVSGQATVTEYRYHDGHYDGQAREYLGFAEVEVRTLAAAREAEVWQRQFFHTRGASARDPAFIAGKGQPHRTELLDPATAEVRRIDEAAWQARGVATADPSRPAYLALETRRTSRRLEGGVVYEEEWSELEHDAIGNVTRERRVGQWTDADGIARVDELVIETAYASHLVHGLTSFASRLTRRDGAGRILKRMQFFYDGLAFVGLPLDVVEHGWKSRQTEVALTAAEIAEAYGGAAPPLLATLYRTELDPELGTVFVKDTRRYRHDTSGNEVETIDALGHRVTVEFDAEAIHPVTLADDGGPARALTYDPIAQQAARVEDLNGQTLEMRYDGLGNVVAVYRRGARPDRPTETYEYRFDVVPNVVIRRLRLLPDDAAPGSVTHEYRDGSGRVCQVKTLAEDGRWAVGKQQILSIAGRELGERDAYFADSPDYEPAPPPGVAERAVLYDFAARVVEERLFGGGVARHVYAGNVTRFYGPDRTAALAADPATPATRVSRTSAAGKIVALEEHDEDGWYRQRREYDALGRLTRIVDPLGLRVLACVYDFWGNRIRIDSAEAGTLTHVYDAGGNVVLRTDADGRAVYTPRDVRGRIIEVRRDGPGGPLEETCTYDTGAGDNVRGRLAFVAGDFGTVEYGYSAEGDATVVRRTFAGHPTVYEVRFGYDHQRNLRFVVYPDGTRVDYVYHPNGQLAAIPGFVDAVEYAASGKRQRVVFANGLETRQRFTPGDELLAELLSVPTAGGPSYQHLVYHLDAVGQVVAIDDLATVPGKMRNPQTFAYDTRNRLVHATGRGAGGDWAFEYRHDALGNVVFSGEAFGEEVEYGHDAGDVQHPNRLLRRRSAPGAEYRYDASGNLTADPVLGTLAYDARHRLVRVDRPDGAIVEYRYDHADRRTESRLTRDGVTRIRYEIDGFYFVDDSGGTKIVVDQERRLAVVPATGDGLLYHLDRLGNINVVSNLRTGAFVGHDEYTPYGQLSVSMLVTPHFQFQGSAFSDGLDIVLLGARFYRPALGRFLTPDLYLVVRADRIPGILAGANLYIYALANPANFTDPTGRLAFLAILLIAALVGAALGALGAAVNGAKTWDEWLMWIVGGAVGGVLVALAGAGIAVLFVGCSAAATGAGIAVVIWASASFLGTLFTPLLDKSDSWVAWSFSFLLKWIQSPITTTIGLIAALVVWIAGGNVDFKRGMLFIEVGSGYGALTLGGVAWTLKDGFDADGNVKDDLARHESYHSRTVVALGELGFYATYITVGGLLGVIQGGPWIGLNGSGCGNPLEKTPWPYDHPGAPTKSASECW
jgi:RHS repeat-associated protein